MATQTQFNVQEPVESVETYEFEPIQGYPMLRWKGKRPFESTQYYPAQLKETYGEEVDNWRNKIYWGDNLQVMSHLLKTYRGKINLIYIDPPFDSKADYKKRIELKGKKVENDRTAFEEKQYTDIWTNDEYLQFMYERLILMKELLADNGSIYVHCDWRVNSYLRLVLDEIFGMTNFRNEIIWTFGGKGMANVKKNYFRNQNSILFYSKSDSIKPNLKSGVVSQSVIKRFGKYMNDNYQVIFGKLRNSGDALEIKKAAASFVRKHGRYPNDDDIVRDYSEGSFLKDVWDDIVWWDDLVWDNIVWDNIPIVRQNKTYQEFVGYPTQKPEALLERIINVSSKPGDIVFDCFMGSGTTQAVAMKLGRRFIGADINLGAVETTTKRLLKIQKNAEQGEIDLQGEDTEAPKTVYTGFEVYNVNNYDVFRNPAQAKDLLIEALEIQPLPTGGIYDGEKDGRMVKIMPINRIATRADLGELITGFDRQAFQRRQEKNPTQPVEKLLLVCMGHESDLAAELEKEVPSYKLDIEVMDILRQKSELEFKRESEAKIVRRNGHLTIEQFYPMNLLQKLSLLKENVENWKELVESVKVDFNYDGAVMNPSVVDSPEEDKLVKGTYPIPEDAGTIRVKITDLLSESLEETVE